MPGACRNHRRVVMLGEGGKRRIQCRLEPKSLGNRRLEVVADRRLRYATEVTKGPLVGLDPVWQLLAEAGIGKRQLRCAQHRHIDLCRADLAGRWIDDRDRMAGIVAFHRDTCNVTAAVGGPGSAFVIGKPAAKPGVPIAIRMSFPVFLPKQMERDALALQFAGHLRPVRLDRIAWRPPHSPE